MKYLELVATIDTASRKLLGRAAAAVNESLVLRNWLVGAYIVEFEQNGEDRAKYGTRLLPRLAADLKKREVGGTSPDMLERMRQVYFTYPQISSEISAPVVRKLTVHLLGDVGGKKSSSLVEKSVAESDPYVLEFTGLAGLPHYTENDLETALLDHLQKFLLELGTGFCFEARQFRVTTGNEHDYVDLVFYHRRLRCHILLDLKIRPFKHGDAGQMNYYLNYFKDRMMADGDQQPVGILLCSDKDHTKVEFATAGMANKLFVSRYLTALPSAEQLQRFVETDRARIEALTDSRSSAPAPRAKSTAAETVRPQMPKKS